jgi:hypothetical protein
MGEGTKSPDRCCCIPSRCTGRCGFRPPFQVVRSLWDGLSVVMLTARVSDGLDPMEKPAFIRANLSNVRVIMTIIHVPVVEFRCQAAMGWIPALKYLLSYARELLWPHTIVPVIKCCHFLRFGLPWCLPDIESP